MSRYIGNFLSKNSNIFLNSKNGFKKSLSTFNISNYSALPKDNHHGHGALIATEGSSVNGIKTYLFKQNDNCNFNGFVRHYSNKIQTTPTPKELLGSLCESEIADFKTLLPENQEEGVDEVAHFIEENGYNLKTEIEYHSEIVFLTKTFADGTEITIKFESTEEQNPMEDDMYDQENQEEGEQNENENENENEDAEENEQDEQEQGEEAEENEEEPSGHIPQEHPFEIQVKTSSGKPITFGCFASQDGNYTISAFYGGSFKQTLNPVDISGTSSEFQDNILLLLQQYGVNEKLAFFIHDYVHSKKLKDYIQSFESLQEFVSRK